MEIKSQQKEHKLYISRIPNEVQLEELVNHFSKFGEITVTNVKKSSRKHKPYAVEVVTLSYSTFQKILTHSPHSLRDNSVEIEVEECLTGEALLKKEEEIFEKRVSIFGVYGKVTNEDLKEAFSQFGKVDYCYLNYYPDNPAKAHGFVTFFNQESASAAIKAKRVRMNRKNVKIKKFRPKKKLSREENKSKDQDRGNVGVTESREIDRQPQVGIQEKESVFQEHPIRHLLQPSRFIKKADRGTLLNSSQIQKEPSGSSGSKGRFEQNNPEIIQDRRLKLVREQYNRNYENPDQQNLPSILYPEFEEYYCVIRNKLVYERIPRLRFSQKYQGQHYDHDGSMKSILVTTRLVAQNHSEWNLRFLKSRNFEKEHRRSQKKRGIFQF